MSFSALVRCAPFEPRSNVLTPKTRTFINFLIGRLGNRSEWAKYPSASSIEECDDTKGTEMCDIGGGSIQFAYLAKVLYLG